MLTWMLTIGLCKEFSYTVSAGVQYFNNQINKLVYYERPSNHILI